MHTWQDTCGHASTDRAATCPHLDEEQMTHPSVHDVQALDSSSFDLSCKCNMDILVTAGKAK